MGTPKTDVKKKECPSCAMKIDADSKQCPVCQYEFPASNAGLKWAAILLALLFLFYMLFL
jgi:RNA polymerase subunit RPABC4/transcription elongation factor Spt4